MKIFKDEIRKVEKDIQRSSKKLTPPSYRQSCRARVNGTSSTTPSPCFKSWDQDKQDARDILNVVFFLYPDLPQC